MKQSLVSEPFFDNKKIQGKKSKNHIGNLILLSPEQGFPPYFGSEDSLYLVFFPELHVAEQADHVFHSCHKQSMGQLSRASQRS